MNEVLAIGLTRITAGGAHVLNVDGHEVAVDIDVA
jgi:hypothetical protein